MGGRYGKDGERRCGGGKEAGGGKARGLFLKWAGTGFAGGERRFPQPISGTLRERRQERRKDGLQLVV